MYSDLDKTARGGFIIEDALVINEVFNTALNVRRGQIFYCRGLGQDFEYYLLRLNEDNTLLGIQDELFMLRNVDGRLIVDTSQTQVYTDEGDGQAVVVQTAVNVQGLPELSVTGMVEESTEGVVSTVGVVGGNLQIIRQRTTDQTGDYSVTLNDGRILEFKDSKLQAIITPTA